MLKFSNRPTQTEYEANELWVGDFRVTAEQADNLRWHYVYESETVGPEFSEDTYPTRFGALAAAVEDYQNADGPDPDDYAAAFDYEYPRYYDGR